MSQSGQGSSVGVIFAAVVIFALLLQLVKGLSPGDSTMPPATVPDRSSFEHRYVQERFKQEGYSQSEAQQAADAIIKFQRAQEARR